MTGLDGRVAVVTGASRGIGRAIAIGLAATGARVAVTARTEEPGAVPGTIHQTVEAIRAAGGIAMAVRCDIGVESDVQRMAERVHLELGPVDVLINNAAVGLYTPFKEIVPKHFDLVFRINVKGAFLCTRAVLPGMLERRRGSIVNISSSAAENTTSLIQRDGEPTRSSGIAYGASKAALERLTLGLAEELRDDNIAVNAIKPARPTASEGLRHWVPELEDDDLVDPNRFMTPAVTFLARQDAAGVAGTISYDETLCREHGLVA